MRKLNWDPITNDKLWPRLMAALRQVMADNYETDPEIDKASALDALDVPYELDENGEPQIDPVGTWPVSALREIASQSGKSIDYLLGDTNATTNPRHAEEIAEVATNLKDVANALEELAEVVAPNLPIGPRELFDVAETEIFKRLRTCMHRMQEVANDIEKANEEA